jgi:hypothetical protein
MSRPRKPTAVLEASGAFEKNPQRRLSRSGEPACVGNLGSPPESLDCDEKALWTEIASTLPDGLAGKSDRSAFECLVVLGVKCRRGKALLSERRLLQQYLSKFGLTPADRNKVSVSAATDADALTQFLEKKEV